MRLSKNVWHENVIKYKLNRGQNTHENIFLNNSRSIIIKEIVPEQPKTQKRLIRCKIYGAITYWFPLTQVFLNFLIKSP